jgi:hypothetical protein
MMRKPELKGASLRMRRLVKGFASGAALGFLAGMLAPPRRHLLKSEEAEASRKPRRKTA